MRRLSFQKGIAPVLLLAILIGGAAGADPSVLFGQAVLLLLTAAGLLFLVWTAFQTEPAWKPVRFFAGLSLALFLCAVYYFNPAYRWPADGGAVPVRHIGILPAAAFPPGVPGVLPLFAAALTAVGLALHLSPKQVDVLVGCVLAAAAVTAIVVLEQRLMPRPYPVFELTGFFSYENQYAAFANLTIPPALVYGERLSCRAFQRGRVSSPAIFCYAAAALSAAAVLMSRSRSGMVITGLMALFFLWRRNQLRRRYPFAAPALRRPARIAFGLAGAVAAGGLFFTAVYTTQSASRLGEELGFRKQILSDALSVGRAHPCWGTGPGSFAAVFPYYQTAPADHFFFRHAHCEPVELLAEYGLLGSGMLLTALMLVLSSGPRDSGDPHTPPVRELEGSGFLLALGGVGLHSLVDFPLRHPFNALLACLWLGLAARSFGGGAFLTRGFILSRQKRRSGEAP